LLKIRAVTASIKCASDMKVKELNSQTKSPFFAKHVPSCFEVSSNSRVVYLNI